MKALVKILLWGLVTGAIHFVIMGVLYGNPFIDKIYQKAQKDSPGVKKWESRAKYLLTQFLGTQVEIFIMTAGFYWIKTLVNVNCMCTVMQIGLIFAGIRVYPRFWNMWIQSTYPNSMLLIEGIFGTISTFIVVISLYLLPF